MEQWGPIENCPPYQVSSWGRVRNKKGLILKPDLTPSGYLRVLLTTLDGTRTNRCVHRLVAGTFVDNGEGKPYVNHVDGNRTNNTISNLEWVTPQENSQKKVYPATQRKGRHVVQLTYDDEFVRDWRCLSDAAKQLRICATNIAKSCRGGRGYNGTGGYRWKYADDYYPQPEDEVWKEIEVDRVKATVSSLGRIKTKVGAFTAGSHKSGYLYYNSLAIHRCVALAFPELCPKPDGASIVNHKDGDKHNNEATNLEWVTRPGNASHAYQTGLNPNTRPVRQLGLDGTDRIFPSAAEAARQTGATTHGIMRACQGKGSRSGGSRWEYVADEQKADRPAPSPTMEELDAYLDEILRESQ